MHEFVSLDCRIIPAGQSTVSATSAAVLYGKGVFTSIAIYNSKPFQWQKHWQRLNENARKVSIDSADISEQKIKNALDEIIAANAVKDGRARLSVYDESASRIWQNEPKCKTSLLIQTADFRSVAESFRLTVSPFAVNSKSPLAGVKSCNYLENILALDAAKAKGFDEAIRTNERGEIVSAAMANVFWTTGGEIFTPSLKTGCLAGTTRALFLENFAVSQIEGQIKVLTEADAVFLTSTGIGIVKVESIEERILPANSQVIERLQKFFRNFTANS